MARLLSPFIMFTRAHTHAHQKILPQNKQLENCSPKGGGEPRRRCNRRSSRLLFSRQTLFWGVSSNQIILTNYERGFEWVYWSPFPHNMRINPKVPYSAVPETVTQSPRTPAGHPQANGRLSTYNLILNTLINHSIRSCMAEYQSSLGLPLCAQWWNPLQSKYNSLSLQTGEIKRNVHPTTLVNGEMICFSSTVGRSEPELSVTVGFCTKWNFLESIEFKPSSHCREMFDQSPYVA